MKYDLNKKVVLITGAAGGIGAATAREFYTLGANLVLTDMQQEAVDKLASEFEASRVLPLALDVTDAVATKEVVQKTIKHFGHLDIAFANAGISWRDGASTIASCDEAEFDKIVEVDLLGVWRTVRAALPEVTRNKGQILITSSVYCFVNGMANAPYAASKAAVEMLGRCLRTEIAYTDATASVVYPGWTATPIAKVAFGGNATVTKMIEAAFPAWLRKPISPEYMAQAIVKVCSVASHAFLLQCAGFRSRYYAECLVQLVMQWLSAIRNCRDYFNNLKMNLNLFRNNPFP